uniref:Uncharacterized protein n=1 Tax=Acrobeloides nanus TaxID=290746 RepID=A0A914CNG0_9BILA
MLRPLTTRGGDLACVYALWNIYADVDLRYADATDVVTMATGRTMVVEIVMNLVALILGRLNSKHSLMVAFTTSAFCFWKTIIYMVMYIRPPAGTPSYISQTATNWEIFWVFWVADGIWVIIPLAVMIDIWLRITSAPRVQTPKYSEVTLEDTTDENGFENFANGTNLSAKKPASIRLMS